MFCLLFVFSSLKKFRFFLRFVLEQMSMNDEGPKLHSSVNLMDRAEINRNEIRQKNFGSIFLFSCNDTHIF